jgi:hypothetical protein
MMLAPESAMVVSGFEDFDFAAYEQELSDISAEEQAQAALADILTIQADDGATKSYEQIKQETEVFFSNPAIMQMGRVLDELAMQYAAFCLDRCEEAATTDKGLLGNVYARGLQRLRMSASDHGHNSDHGSAGGNGKKKKKKRYGATLGAAACCKVGTADP